MALWKKINNMAVWKKSILHAVVCFILFCLISYAMNDPFDIRHTVSVGLMASTMDGLTFPFMLRLINSLSKKVLDEMGVENNFDKKSDPAG